MTVELPRILVDRRARFLPAEAHSEQLKSAAQTAQTLLARYWSAEQVRAAIEPLPVHSSATHALTIRSEDEFAIVALPLAGIRTRWSLHLIAGGVRVWRKTIPDLHVMIETVIGVIHAARQDRDIDLRRMCQMAFNHSRQPHLASPDRLRTYHMLELSIEECVALIGRSPGRIAGWFERVGLSAPRERLAGSPRRLIDRVMAHVGMGGKIHPIAMRERVTVERIQRIVSLGKMIAAARRSTKK